MRRDILEASVSAFRNRRERWRREQEERTREAARKGMLVLIGDPPSERRHIRIGEGEDYEGTPLARVEL
jgi:hypothetical protein